MITLLDYDSIYDNLISWMLSRVEQKQRCFKMLFCFDLAMILVLVSSAIYQGDSISESQSNLTTISTTLIEKQFCSELCSHEYFIQHAQLCCTSTDFSKCQQKSKCKIDLVQDMQDTIASKYAWFYAIFGCLGFFLLNFIVVLCLSFNIRRDLLREQLNRRRNNLARLLFYANQLTLFLQEERLRRRSLLTEQFIGEESEDTCAVCLDDFEGKKVIKLRCNHLFHSECISNWIEYQTTCPVCRAAQ